MSANFVSIGGGCRLKKKTFIKIAVAMLAVSIISFTVVNKFFINTQASPPDSSLPQTFDSSMLLLETRTSDFTGVFFNVMTPGENTVIIYKTNESFPVNEKPKALWGLTNYDFFIQMKSGKTICYKFNVSDWEKGLQVSAVKTQNGCEVFLINPQTGEKSAYNWRNIPAEFLTKAIEYTSLQANPTTVKAAAAAYE